MRVFAHDTESYPNLFVFVAQDLKRKQKPVIFIRWEYKEECIDERPQLLEFLLQEGLFLIGYGNLKYDNVLLEAIIRNPEIGLKELNDLGQEAFKEDHPRFSEKDSTTQFADALKICHFDNKNKATSLKQLEFFFRKDSIDDLPFPPGKIIKTRADVKKVVTYCTKDTDFTTFFCEKIKKKIQARVEVKRELGLHVMNMSDVLMGESIIIKALCDEMKTSKEELYKKVHNAQVLYGKDAVFNHYPEKCTFTQSVKKNYFEKIVLKGFPSEDRPSLYEFDFRNCPSYTSEWQGMKVINGMGGIHACIAKGVIESDDEYVIKTCDVTSQYPNMLIGQKIYSPTLGPSFVTIYDQKVYSKRAEYPKDTKFAMNQTYKLASNSAIGKMLSVYSPLYYPMGNFQVTCNCQLSIMCLAEMLVLSIPRAQVIMMNTDGMEIRIPRKYEDRYQKICDKWMKITKLKLEFAEYKKMAILGVNSYWAEYTDGKIKRKKDFLIYEDLLNNEEYNKNPSALIIPEALNAYFRDGTPVAETINKWEEVHDFMYGVKGNKDFTYVLLGSNQDRNITMKKYTERVLRYVVSNKRDGNKLNGNLYKLWKDGRLNAVAKCKTNLVTPVQSLKSRGLSKKDLLTSIIDREFYAKEAQKIIDSIEGREVPKTKATRIKVTE